MTPEARRENASLDASPSSSPSHLDCVVTGEALLPLLVTDDDEGPAVLIERHRSRYSGHFGDLARSEANRRCFLTRRLSSSTLTVADGCLWPLTWRPATGTVS